MNAFEILENTRKYFPLIRNENIEFEEYFNSILDEYVTHVTESKDLISNEINNNVQSLLSKDDFITEFKNFATCISNAISFHLSGFPSKAFEELEKAFGLIKVEGKYKYISGSMIVNNGSYSFYRIRESVSRNAFQRKDLFHVPFSKRRKIHTKRYSIPGLPTLYLSNSIYVAWEELNRPKFDSIQASRYELNLDFPILDLTTEVYCVPHFLERLEKENRYIEALDAVFLFPLILACSIKVNNREDVFRPEYIVPQLVLQWVTMSTTFIGINYTSCHVEITNPNFNGVFRNYVLPPKMMNGEFCENLKEMFRMTESLSTELYDLNMNPVPQMEHGTSEKGKLQFIQSIEIIKDQKSPYYETKFGYLEQGLLSMRAYEIDF